MVVVPESTTTDAATLPAVLRNSRRFSIRLLTVPSLRRPLPVAAVPLQDLDLVPVGILDEEEARHQPAVAVELLDRLRVDARPLEPDVLGAQVVDAESHVAVTVAQAVGLIPALVQRQLDLEVGLGIAEVDQREAVEVVPVRHLEVQRLAVEGDRALQVEHADHHVDGLGQQVPPCLVASGCGPNRSQYQRHSHGSLGLGVVEPGPPSPYPGSFWFICLKTMSHNKYL